MSNLRGKRTYDYCGGDKLARELSRQPQAALGELVVMRHAGKGYCEGCGQYRAAPSPRNKGWKCAACTGAAHGTD